MKDSIICTPVMLHVPFTGDAKNYIGMLFKNADGVINIPKDEEDIMRSYQWFINKPQHLYFVSEEPVRKGDKVLVLGKYIQTCEGVHQDFDGIEIDWNPTIDFSTVAKSQSKKVEAATDSLLSLPPIPQSFLEKWVEKQGQIEKVRLKMENPFGHLFPEKQPMWQLALDKNDNVIILPLEKLYNKEEIMDFMAMAIMNDNSSMPMTIDELKKEFSNKFNQKLSNMKEWFNKNY